MSVERTLSIAILVVVLAVLLAVLLCAGEVTTDGTREAQ